VPFLQEKCSYDGFDIRRAVLNLGGILRQPGELSLEARVVNFIQISIAHEHTLSQIEPSVRRLGVAVPMSTELIAHKQLKGAYHVSFRHSFIPRHYRHGTC
jgi:hypothetical protein